MSLKASLSNLDKKENFYNLIDFVLRKVSSGIRGYSIVEIQQLGKISNLINRQNRLKFNDDRVIYFNNQLVVAFKDEIKDESSADELKDVLAFYPKEVIEGIIEAYPNSRSLKKVRNLLTLAENIFAQSGIFDETQNKDIKSNKAIVGRVDPIKFEQSKKVADDLDTKIQQMGIASLEKLMVKLEAKKQELESQMEEITERLGPFVSSDYSKDDIRKWLVGINDEGLFPMEGINTKDAVEYIQKYSQLHAIDLDSEEDINEETDVVSEVKDFMIDVEKVENRIQKVIQTDVNKIKKQLMKSKAEEINDEDDFEDTEGLEEEIIDEIIEDIKESDIIKPIVPELYEQDKVVSKLRRGHNKGTSI